MRWIYLRRVNGALAAGEYYPTRMTVDVPTAGIHTLQIYEREDAAVIDKILITLDLDFSNPFRFPPAETRGIVVVRPPRPTLRAIEATLAAALTELLAQPLAGKLWIVEPGRIRLRRARQ